MNWPQRKFRIDEIADLMGPGARVVPIIGGGPEWGAEAEIVKAPQIVLAPGSALQEGTMWDLRELVEQERVRPVRLTLMLVAQSGRRVVYEVDSLVTELKTRPLTWGSGNLGGRVAEWAEWTMKGQFIPNTQRKVTL